MMEAMTAETLGMAALAYLVVRETFSYMKGRKESPLTAKVIHQIDDLHEWHAKEDADGVKVWYVRRSLEDSIQSLAETLLRLERIMERQTVFIERVISERE